MPFVRRHLLFLSLAALTSVLAVRMVWRTSHTETGWEMQRRQWVRVPLNLLGMETRTLEAEDPPLQARFWLSVVDRVPSVQTDAKVAVGAAWMLDSPQAGFYRHCLKVNEKVPKLDGVIPGLEDVPNLFLAMRMEVDYELIERLGGEFESLCGNKCCELIDRATRLDAQNIEWWRAMGLLVTQSKWPDPDNMLPRRNDWLAVLDECARHDPDNALYDYIAAIGLWIKSAARKFDKDATILRIRDQAVFEQGDRRFAAAQKKPQLKFCRQDITHALAFVEHAPVDKLDRVTAVESRGIDARAQGVLIAIQRWQSARMETEKRHKEYGAAAATLKGVLHATDQMEGAEVSPRLMQWRGYIRRWGLSNLKLLSEEHPGVFTEQETASIRKDLEAARVQDELYSEAARRLNKKLSKSRGPKKFAEAGSIVPAQMAALGLGGAAMLLWGLAVTLDRRQERDDIRLGIVRQLAAWTFGIGLSFVLFGLCPAGVISPDVQTGCVRAIVGLALLSPIACFFVWLRKKLQVSQLQFAALACTASIPIAFILFFNSFLKLLALGSTGSDSLLLPLMLAAIIGLAWFGARVIFDCLQNGAWAERRFALAAIMLVTMSLVVPAASTAVAATNEWIDIRYWILPRMSPEASKLALSPAELRGVFKLDDHAWVWAFIQWVLYEGLASAALFALVAAWLSLRPGTRTEGGWREILGHQKRRHLALIARTGVRLLTPAAILSLLIYLAVSPADAKKCDDHYHEQYAQLANPPWNWASINAEVESIKQDKQLLEEFRQKKTW